MVEGNKLPWHKHYSTQNGHSERSKFHSDVKELRKRTGMSTDQAYMMRRHMLRTPDSGRR